MELDMPRQWQEQSTDNLSGGITDYVDNAPPSQSAIIENFVITRDRGIRVRDGSGIWSVTYPNLPGQRKVLQLFQLEEYIFAYTISLLIQMMVIAIGRLMMVVLRGHRYRLQQTLVINMDQTI
jgi:hypothetical protein